MPSPIPSFGALAYRMNRPQHPDPGGFVTLLTDMTDPAELDVKPGARFEQVKDGRLQSWQQGSATPSLPGDAVVWINGDRDRVVLLQGRHTEVRSLQNRMGKKNGDRDNAVYAHRDNHIQYEDVLRVAAQLPEGASRVMAQLLGPEGAERFCADVAGLLERDRQALYPEDRPKVRILRKSQAQGKGNPGFQPETMRDWYAGPLNDSVEPGNLPVVAPGTLAGMVLGVG